MYQTHIDEQETFQGFDFGVLYDMYW